MICDALATESFGKPETLAGSGTLPGAPAQARLLVSGTQTTVAIRLLFSGSPCTTTTGLRKPGPEPAGAGRSAHQISPCETSTTRCVRGRAERRRGRRRREGIWLSSYPEYNLAGHPRPALSPRSATAGGSDRARPSRRRPRG